MCICILNLLHILILTHFKFLLTSQPSNGSCIGPIANQYLVAWGIWYRGIWWQCRETDFTLSCNKHYLHLQGEQWHKCQKPLLEVLTRQKNWIVSNQWCTVALLHQFSTTSSKVFCTVCFLCVYLQSYCYIIVPLCTKIYPQEEGGRTHYHHSGNFNARGKKPKSYFFYSSPPTGMASKAQGLLFLFITFYQHDPISNITYLHFPPIL